MPIRALEFPDKRQAILNILNILNHFVTNAAIKISIQSNYVSNTTINGFSFSSDESTSLSLWILFSLRLGCTEFVAQLHTRAEDDRELSVWSWRR